MGSSKQKVNLDTTDESRSFQERIDEVRSLVEENLRYTKAIRESNQPGGLKNQKELQKLLQENLKISRELYQMTKKIKRWVTTQRIWGVLKILIIIIPIVLGIVYLPPLVKKGIEPLQEVYQEFLGFTQGAEDQGAIIQQITNQLKGDETRPK